MLEFENISKSFQSDFWVKPVKILDNLSFEVCSGSLCGFLGANGAGKTTSIKILFRFIKPDSGKIIFSETLGKNWDSIRQSLGYFPERPYFYPYLSARQFVHYIGGLEGLSSPKIKTKLEKLSEKFDIAHSLDKKVKDFSKGMLQRLGFIVSIIHNPKLLILDEPLSGLDPNGRMEFKNVLKELSTEGTTIFFSSHIVSDIQEICDSLVVIEKGKLVFNGKTSDLIKQNSKDEFEVRIRDRDQILFDLYDKVVFKTGEDITFRIIKSDLNEFLDKSLKAQGVEILSVKPFEKTLEQVVYCQKGDA